MYSILAKIILAFDDEKNLEFNYDQFIDYDKFIDNEILNECLIKYDEQNFVGENFAIKINNQLLSNKKIIALNPLDKRIDTRAKGQAAYFLVNDKIAILTFSTNGITFFPIK